MKSIYRTTTRVRAVRNLNVLQYVQTTFIIELAASAYSNFEEIEDRLQVRALTHIKLADLSSCSCRLRYSHQMEWVKAIQSMKYTDDDMILTALNSDL